MNEPKAREALGTMRTIQFSGGTVYVSLPTNGPEGPVVGLHLYGWEDGVTVALSAAKADELAQALREFALAAAQASAALVGRENVEVRS